MDFAGVSLLIKTLGEDKVTATLDKIDKRGQQVSRDYANRQEIDLERVNQAWKKGARSHAEAADVLSQSVSKSMDAMATRSASAVTGMARGLEMVARTGNLTGRSLDSVALRASELALGFGSTGYLVGAIAIGGAAIVETFHRWDEAIEKTKDLLTGLNEESVRLKAEGEGNSLGVKQLELADAYLKKIKELESHRPGMLARAASEALIGFGQATNSPSLTDYGLSIYPAQQLRTDIAIRQAGANLLQGDKNASAAEAAKKAKEAEQAEDKHISSLSEIIRLQTENGGVLLEADRLIQKYTASLSNANLSEETRAKILGRIHTLQGAENEGTKASPIFSPDLSKFGRGGFGNGGIPASIAFPDPLKDFAEQLKESNQADQFLITEGVKRTVENMKQEMDKAQHDIDAKAQKLGNALVTGITEGLRAAMSKGGGLGAGFKAMTQGLLSGLGSMFAEVAEKALIGSQLLKTIAKAISEMNPWVAAAAALALMAFGNALQGSGGGGSGGGSYSGGYAGGSSVVDRGIINPTAPTGPVTNPSNITARPTNNLYATIIGTRDPVAMRQIQELINNANARGNV